MKLTQQLCRIIEPYEAIFNSKLSYTLHNVNEKIMVLAEQCVDKNVSAWNEGYKALPLDFIASPKDPLCDRFGH
ncbi:hypothetical protein ACSVDA_03730 [Cytobacillus sp. Hm23]